MTQADRQRRPRHGWCACAPRWPRWPRPSTTPCRPAGRDDVRVGTRVRAPFHGRTVRGWVVDEDVGTPAGRRRPPAEVVAGLGPADGRRGAGGVGGLALGRPGLVLPPERLPGDHRAQPARSRRAGAGARRRRRRAGALDLDLAQPGVDRRAPAPARPIRSTSCCPSSEDDGRACPGGSVLVLVPSTGWAERLAARLVRRGWPTAGTWEQARAGWPVVVGSRAAAWAPVPGWRPRSCSTRTTPPTGRRARPPTARSTCCSSGPAGRACPAFWSHRCRRSRWRRDPVLRTVAPSRPRSGPGWPASSGSTAAGRTRAAACSPRSSSGWPGRCSTMPRRGAARPAGLRLQPHGRRPPAGLPPLRRAGLLRPLRRRRGAAPGRGGAALPALRRDPPGRVRGLRPAAHEDAAGRA